MAYDIRLPNITATTEKGQLEQIRSYLYQFAEQLNYAVNIIDGNAMAVTKQVQTAVNAVDSPTTEQKVKQFGNLKNLIISSADIVNAYYEEITHRLEGNYVAMSPDFGTYWKETTAEVKETSENLTTYYEMLQRVNDWQLNTSAYIKTGYLGVEDEQGYPVSGVEVGAVSTDENGNVVYEGKSRFTPTEVSFYDARNNKMATLNKDELIVNGIICKGNFYIGNFVIDTIHGFSIKPSGRSVV